MACDEKEPGRGKDQRGYPSEGGERQNFRQALNKLASDPDYRTVATADPQRLVSDFQLEPKELEALRTAAIMSGADVTAVDLIRADSIKQAALGRAKGETWASMENGGSGCSCCCCCCGETSVVTIVG
ncbi:hypothetical protein ACWD6Q_34230 [Streptomyces nigra]|uniref:hypothetical protein n=1 Tax=Streptomyces nigra TaxID=1827580 RepID=UPI0036947DBC